MPLSAIAAISMSPIVDITTQKKKRKDVKEERGGAISSSSF
jgi:hypothetical protein